MSESAKTDTKPALPAWIDLVRNVSDNQSQIKWPTDVWGFTSDLRKEFALLVGKLNGHPAKTEILLATLAIMTAHVKKRTAKDDRTREARRAFVQAGAEARKPLERFGTYNTNSQEAS